MPRRAPALYRSRSVYDLLFIERFIERFASQSDFRCLALPGVAWRCLARLALPVKEDRFDRQLGAPSIRCARDHTARQSNSHVPLWGKALRRSPRSRRNPRDDPTMLVDLRSGARSRTASPRVNSIASLEYAKPARKKRHARLAPKPRSGAGRLIGRPG